MLNLAESLKADITAGIMAAMKAGVLPSVATLPPVVIKPSDDNDHGDYASPFAMSLSKLMKKAPLEIVEATASHMEKPEYLGKLEAAAPGFLNIWISPGWMSSRLDNVLHHDVCADITIGAGKAVNLEFISANPTGPLTLGNARTAFTADTLANVLSCAGFNVTREYYINDAGAQIAKLGESVLRRILQSQGETVDFPEEMYQGDYITELAQEIAEKLQEDKGKEYTKEDLEDEEIKRDISQQAMQTLLAHIKQTVAEDLKIKFDVWTSEAALKKEGLIEVVLQKLREHGVTYEKDGAEYLKTTQFGDEKDRVLVKKNKEYAYIAPDIAYHQNKFDRKFDLLFTFLGADHQGHVPKLQAAMQALGNDVNKLKFPIGQWFSLVRDKKVVAMSKRKGNIYTPKELIDEVGYDAARFFFVQHKLDTHMEFDLDLAKEKSERNPVYYVQYAYVRLQSILRRAKEEGVISEIGMNFEMTSHPVLTHTTELHLMRTMYRFPELVAGIADDFMVHQLVYYAQDLAKAIHAFYKNVPVLAEEAEAVKMSRLQLVLAAQGLLGKTLDLLGVSKPDIM